MSKAVKKPANAYEQYKKLMRDFNALEDEIRASAAYQRELQTAFVRVKGEKTASEERQRQRETAKWAAERDEQLRAIVEQEELVRRLGLQADELQQRETRLQAELEVLHERQRAERMTEAVRLRQLIHNRSHLLETELTNARVDLDAIVQILDAAPSSGGSEINRDRADAAASSLVRALVQSIHERRSEEFEAATRRLQEQVTAFGLEQQALRLKADEIRTRTQRALQVLSSNQQVAIKDFFTARPVGIRDAPDALPAQTSDVIARHADSLNFAAIMDRMDPRVPSNALEQLGIDTETGRRQVEDALRQAQAAVASGPGRVLDLEREIARRQQETDELDDSLHTAALSKLHRQSLVASPWTLDSCPPELLPAALFARDVVLECAASAVNDVERRRADAQAIARVVLSKTLMEVIDETAAQLLEELRSVGSGKKARGSIGSAFRSVFHRGKRAPQASGSRAKTSK